MKSNASIDEFVDQYSLGCSSISEIRLGARKKGIWKEVRRELQKRYHIKDDTEKADGKEPCLNEVERTAKELVQIFLRSDDAYWGMRDLRREAKKQRT